MDWNLNTPMPSPQEDPDLNEVLEMLDNSASGGHTEEWATCDEMDEMLKNMSDLESLDLDVEKLTDICNYEDISPYSSDSEAEEEQDENRGNIPMFSSAYFSLHREMENADLSLNKALFDSHINRVSTCQEGMGQPRRKNSRRSMRDMWDSSESEEDDPRGPEDKLGQGLENEPSEVDNKDKLQETVLDPSEETVVEPLVDPSEETVVEPVVDPSKETVVDPVVNPLEESVVEPVSDGVEEVKRDLREQIDDFPSTFFEVHLRKTRSFKHMKHDIVNEYSYQVNLREEAIVDGNYLVNILPQMHLMFASILKEIQTSHSPNDLVRIFITHQDVVATNIIVGPDFLDKLTADRIINHISDVIHSNNFIPANKGLSINVTAIRNISGLNRLCVTNIFQDLSRKGCIIAINNDDNLCLPRAIVVALIKEASSKNSHNSSARRLYERIRKKDRNKGLYQLSGGMSFQKRSALTLMKRAGIPFDSVGLLSHVSLYESATQSGITVISARSGNKKVFNGNPAYNTQITLYHSEDQFGKGHFSVLTKVNALLNKAFYCNECDVGFNSSTKHRCLQWCNLCGHNSCIKQADAVYCSDCNAACRSIQCLVRHKERKSDKWPSKCQQMFFCPLCSATLKHPNKPTYRKSEDHICGENFCNNCKVFYWAEHKCYMRSTTASKSSGSGIEDKRFVFYDFESMVDEEGHHVPNLVVANSICSWCQDVTHVKPADKCNFCGSRCQKCQKWNRKENQFEKYPCEGCGNRQVIFQGEGTVNRFCAWLISEQHCGVTVIAHNARSYDSYFIYSYLLSNGIRPSIIFRGAKIINLHIMNNLNIRFLDSLNFLSMPLSQLPKSFGLTEMKKGFFPHLYNTEKVVNNSEMLHLDSYPDSKFYDPDSMNTDRREEFFSWYDRNRQNNFDFFSELQEYCKSDVDILLNACWKFRELVAQVTGPENPIDAFDYLTMPSLCMGIFRTKFLPEKWLVLDQNCAREGCSHEWNCICTWTPACKANGDANITIQDNDGLWVPVNRDEVVKQKFISSPIALIPQHGYSRRDNFSKEAMGYIKWFEKCYRKQNNLFDFNIQHAKSPGGEKVVVHGLNGSKQIKYKLDGYFKDSKGLEHAVEFYGCWFHGCPECYPRDRDKLVIMNKTMTRRHQETVQRASKIREMGFVLHEMWSCEFSRMIQLNREIEKFIQDLEISDTIDVREAYFGGRTNAIKLYEKFNRIHPGKYFDFCSLYPDVLKYNKYPVGHPDSTTNSFVMPTSYHCSGNCPYTPCSGMHVSLPYFGLMKVRILPPKQLMFPVLPMKINGKLMFPLCSKCARAESQDPCTCSDTDRSLLNTWCTPEVETALNMGYKLLETFEVLHWNETEMIDRNTGQGGLFTDYINTFLRVKTQASGYPPGKVTDAEKMSYIQEYFQHEGVLLKADEIIPNPGLRSLAKLALNSFYGKFGQKENMKKCSFLTSGEDIYGYLTDYSKKITDFHLLSDSMLAVEYSMAKEFSVPDPKTNAVIAAFCTCYARLKLWLEMNRLGTRVIYHDTDSVIFTHDPGGYNPRTGSFLGQLTDELTCKGVGCKGCKDGHWIEEFVSCGAKNYAYKLNSGQVVCKVRGFSLNFSASKVVNLTAMKQCLQSWVRVEDPPDLVTVNTMILRKKMEGIVYSQVMPKTYGMVYNKRILLDDYNTLPYGYG